MVPEEMRSARSWGPRAGGALVSKRSLDLIPTGQRAKTRGHSQTSSLWHTQPLCFSSVFWESWQDSGDTGNKGVLGSNFPSVVTCFKT